jgi:hypothetical protein
MATSTVSNVNWIFMVASLSDPYVSVMALSASKSYALSKCGGVVYAKVWDVQEELKMK